LVKKNFQYGTLSVTLKLKHICKNNKKQIEKLKLMGNL